MRSPRAATLRRVGGRVDRLARRAYHRLRALNYRAGIATPTRSVAGTHWSYEPVDTHRRDRGLAVLAEVPEAAVVVDVGAHVGAYAVPLALAGRTVHAVEPNPVAVDRLRRNARRNDAGVRVHPVGLGVAADERRFYRSTLPKLSSFDRAAATRWGASVAAVERVPVRTLDGLVEGVADGTGDGDGEDPEGTGSGPIPPPDAVKLDVEGAELDVLRGGRRTVEQHHPLLVVEHHGDSSGDPGALAGWLRELGYRVDDHGTTWVCRHPDAAVTVTPARE